MTDDLDTTDSATTHLLSFDVEEYFHVEAAAAGVSRDQWPCLSKRLHEPVMRILQSLADHDASATFFVLGWVARHEPQLVREIARAGHEIASHGMSHRMLNQLSPQQFRQELLDSRHLLQDTSSQPVIGYRAPTFSVTYRTAWALDELAQASYRYDSSVFPVRHDRYGVPNAPACPHQAIGPDGGSILEIPPLTVRMMGSNWPIGGGGYLRLLPIRLLHLVLKKAGRCGQPAMIYLHPWELDPGQPVLPMSTLTRSRHRVGLGRTEKKLRYLLQRHRFTSVRNALATLTSATSHQYALPGATDSRQCSGAEEPLGG